MPDWCHLTPPPNRPSQGEPASPCHPRFDPRVLELRALLADLDSCRRGLSALAAELPLASERFSWLAEVRSAIECVHIDLLDDAIETLQHVLDADEITLRRDFLSRRKAFND